jgi:protein subunit release factor B
MSRKSDRKRPRELAFSVTKKDLEFQTMRGSGPGGQHRNKRDTGVRVRHTASGAVGVATDSKSQHENRRNAVRRMTETKEFKLWVKLRLGEMARDGQTIEQAVEEKMQKTEDFRLEVKDEKGRWTHAEDLDTLERP